MARQDADKYTARALYEQVSQACQEIELVLKGDSDIARRIPQLKEACTHVQAAEKLLQETITHVEKMSTVDANPNG